MRSWRNVFYLLLVLAGIGIWIWQRSASGGRPDPAGFNRHTRELILTRHARCRMDCRHVDESEIREVLEQGHINYAKSDPNGRPDPKYALEGITHDGQEVRVIFAPERNRMVVITVIDLGREWPCDCP